MIGFQSNDRLLVSLGSPIAEFVPSRFSLAVLNADTGDFNPEQFLNRLFDIRLGGQWVDLKRVVVVFLRLKDPLFRHHRSQNDLVGIELDFDLPASLALALLLRVVLDAISISFNH